MAVGIRSVSSPKFGAANIQMEPGAGQYTAAGHQLVHHASRPQAREYFERYGGETPSLTVWQLEVCRRSVCSRCHRGVLEAIPQIISV